MTNPALTKAQRDLRFMRTMIVVLLLAVVGYVYVNGHGGSDGLRTKLATAIAAPTTTTTALPVPTTVPITAPAPVTVTTIAAPAPAPTVAPHVAPAPVSAPNLPQAVVVQPVMVRGVATCAKPDPAKVKTVNDYMGPVNPASIPKAVGC